MMVRADLEVGGESLKLCCGAEVDALRRGKIPVEFKTVWEGKDGGFFRNMSTVLQSELVGVKTIVTGIKKGDIGKGEVVVHKVVEKQVEDIKSNGNIGKTAPQCYSFLFTVLTELKRFLEYSECCEMSFNPYRGVVEFKRISKQVAERNGNGVTREFLARFHL
ncbi:hypothetical protein PMAYCL1PPCAC_03212 [Pristionchus mayeri]|uniref:Decapping nuclease n=1 Tax=Pristionchus mayeri TaxID=1317129 RepID=A0AAN5C7R2_9BILA|nr:hypothetical protein PMAYCL1PPCAC_03212 [Pristionchus mayeri]